MVSRVLFQRCSGSAIYELRPFVESVVVQYLNVVEERSLPSNGPMSPRGMAALVGMAAERVYNQGRDVTFETVFDVHNIEATTPVSSPQFKVRRRALTRVAEICLDKPLPEELLFEEPETSSVKPYAPEDFPKIKRWATNRTTHRQREHAEGLLALCLGAGLDGKAASYLKVDDVVVDADGTVWVFVHEFHTHRVPVARVFAPVVEALVQRRKPGQYLLGGDEPVSHGWLNTGQAFSVTPSRLRMTWRVSVVEAVNYELAQTALRTSNLNPYVRHLRKHASHADRVEDRVDELADPFTKWPALRSDQRWQPAPAPSSAVEGDEELPGVDPLVTPAENAVPGAERREVDVELDSESDHETEGVADREAETQLANETEASPNHRLEEGAEDAAGDAAEETPEQSVESAGVEPEEVAAQDVEGDCQVREAEAVGTGIEGCGTAASEDVSVSVSEDEAAVEAARLPECPRCHSVAKETEQASAAKREREDPSLIEQQERYPRSGVTDEQARKKRSKFEVIDGGKK